MPDGLNDVARQRLPSQDLSVGALAKSANPLHEVVSFLNRVATESKLALLNPDLAGMVGKLAEQAAEPGRLEQASFRTGVAYAVQDMEKYTEGKPISMPSELRAELATLSVTSPGLQNERMQALVAKTADLPDRELILDIRQTAQQVARSSPGQDGQELTSYIEALERRAGIVHSMAASMNGAEISQQPGQQKATSAMQDRPAEMKAAAEPEASSKSSSVKVEKEPAGPTSIEERVNATPSPGSGQSQVQVVAEAITTATPTAVATAAQPATTPVTGQPRQAAEVAQVQQQGVAERIVASTRKPQSLDPAPWSVPVPAIGQRIAQFEQRMADGRTERLVQNAERSGAAMMSAMEQFASGPGRSIMSKLEGVATQDPGGMPAVISEMRPGGRYAGERAEFDAALRNPATNAAYKAVTESADKFAGDRLAMANNLNGRKLDPAAADGRFEQMDAALGEQASKLPGREAGKDAMAEMAQKLAELLRKAMAKVEQAIGRVAGVEAQATARPSPSPSASM